MTIIGIAFLAVGAWTYGYSPSASPEIEARCRDTLSSRGPEMSAMVNRCKEKAFAGMFTANDAKSAAHIVGSANQSEVLIHMASMFALGMGSILTLMGVVGLLGMRRRNLKPET